MEGYIALHRKITENEFYFSEKFTKSQAWIDLLLLATHSERTHYIHNIEIKLRAGDLCYSQLSLAERWKWNFKTVKKFLNILEKREMVETKTNNLTTIISIKNWQIYQVSRNKTAKESHGFGEQKGEQKESRMETNNNVNNVNKITTTENKRKRKPLSSEISGNKSLLHSVVHLYSKIQNRSIESSDFAFINRLLQLKRNDHISTVQKCLMLCYVIKKLKEKTSEPKYKGVLYNSYRDLNYTEYHKEVFENKSNRKEIKPDVSIIHEPSINY